MTVAGLTFLIPALKWRMHRDLASGALPHRIADTSDRHRVRGVWAACTRCAAQDVCTSLWVRCPMLGLWWECSWRAHEVLPHDCSTTLRPAPICGAKLVFARFLVHFRKFSRHEEDMHRVLHTPG